MRVSWLEMRDFRNYTSAQLSLAPEGLTVVVGDNGQGKTNLLEAIGYLGRLKSFRQAPNEALIRQGCQRAVLRAECERAGRSLLLEAEVAMSGRDKWQVNRQPAKRSRDVLGTVQVSVFSPDDLSLIKHGPSGRRALLDEIQVSLHPSFQSRLSELERILRQRASLLRQAKGNLGQGELETIDVWDQKLSIVGAEVSTTRRELVTSLEPMVATSYSHLVGGKADVSLRYERSWEGDLSEALAKSRPEDVRRGVNTVGPHRDELSISLEQLPARTHASQGEQRGLALALRLAAHVMVTEREGTPPVLLLDDVFSELDPARSAALVDHLPMGQAVLTTTGTLPPGAAPAVTIRVRGGVLEPVG